MRVNRMAPVDARPQLRDEQHSNPQRLRPPRWTNQIVIATEATTAIMSRIWVVIALIYRRARSKPLVEQFIDLTTRRLAAVLAD